MLTVMMATHNGAGTLPLVLEAYVGLEPPAGGWSVVIADNGSTDATKDLIHAFAGRLPLTYVYEPTPGKNQALNAALPAAIGDLVVFTDDDAVPRPDWLRRFRATADTQTDFHMFGGRIVPRWPTPPEPWILALVPLSVVYGISPPLQSGPVGRQWVFGANMAVRKAIFDLGYRFDPTIGPRGTDYAQGSEAELTQRLEQAGYRAWFCSEAVIEHLISSDHLTEEWILKRARRYGRGRIRRSATESRGWAITGLDVPAPLALHLVVQAVRIVMAWARRDRTALFAARWAWNYLLGQAQEVRGCASTRRRCPNTSTSHPAA
jgi:glycosyltransferase involved in cell wall biosynthesis